MTQLYAVYQKLTSNVMAEMPISRGITCHDSPRDSQKAKTIVMENMGCGWGTEFWGGMELLCTPIVAGGYITYTFTKYRFYCMIIFNINFTVKFFLEDGERNGNRDDPEPRSQAGGGRWPLGGPLREGAGGFLLSNHPDPGEPSERPPCLLACEESTGETKATWHPESARPLFLPHPPHAPDSCSQQGSEKQALVLKFRC